MTCKRYSQKCLLIHGVSEKYTYIYSVRSIDDGIYIISQL